MCGRFALARIPGQLTLHFGMESPVPPPRYNIAPGQYAPALLRAEESRGRITFDNLYWGLVPFWAKDKSVAFRLINARAETAAEKPAFRAAFRHRRCLLPTSGFYEWRREGKTRTPFFFTSTEAEAPLVLAGIWEDWDHHGEMLRSFSILTAKANADMAPVHDRMPVILPESAWDQWLDPTLQRRSELASLLAPAPDGFLAARQVSGYVNKVGNEGPECIKANKG